MENVKWGIIGTGFIANKFAEAVKNSDGAELVAVASRTMDSAKSFSKKHNIKYSFSSYEELLEFGEIDAVYIALPHKYHAHYTKLSIKAGKNVLCEKPITVNEKELNEIIALLKTHKVFVMEAMWTRFLPVIDKIKDVIKSGKIGDVLEISADFCYNTPDRSHHVFDSVCAGGSLLDVGVYGINFATIFLGDEIEDIKASAFVKDNLDERLNVLITYKGGEIARISSALTLDKPESAFIYGTKGYIHIPQFYGAKEFEVITPLSREKYEASYKGNGFEEEIEECNRSILSNKQESDIMPISKSLVIMRIMDKIRKQIGVIYDID